MRVFLTAEVQGAMLDLVKRTKGKKVEYGLQLLLEGDRIYPGGWKWGGVDRIKASFSGIGWFHTHPEYFPLFYRLGGYKPPPPGPPRLSQVDILHIFVSPEHRIVGVGGTEILLAKLIPFGVEETSEVQFASLVKSVPLSLKADILRMLPLVGTLGVPVEGIEEYYELYTFDLTSTRGYPMEVYLE